MIENPSVRICIVFGATVHSVFLAVTCTLINYDILLTYFDKETTPRPFHHNAVLCHILWTVKSTTTAPSTRLSATS